MRVDKVFELLKATKISDVKIHETGINILKYIYQEIYRDCFDAEIERLGQDYNKGSNNYNNAVRPMSALKSNMMPFLDGTESILTYFLEMVKDNKKEFIDLFYEKSSTLFEIVNNHYYDENDFNSLAISFNLYVMLKAYHEHKDNFELYSKIVNDCDFLISCARFFEQFTTSYSNLPNKKKLMDILIASKSYLECSKIREQLKELLKDIDRSYSYEESDVNSRINSIKDVEKAFSDIKELREEMPNASIVSFESISKELMYNSRYGRKENIFYHKYLLLGNRFSYLNNDVKKAIGIDNLVLEIARKVMRMNFTLFNEMSLDSDGNNDFINNDFFVICMNKVLDSDTFYEVSRKLVVLDEATSLYAKGEKAKALELCSTLGSDNYKAVRKGMIFAYMNNTMNITSKPGTIGGRMIEIYERLYPELSNEQINSIMRKALKNGSSTLWNFNEMFDTFILEAVEKEKERCIAQEKAAEEARKELERIESEENARKSAEEVALQEAINNSGIQKIEDISKTGEGVQSPTTCFSNGEITPVKNEQQSGIQKIKNRFMKKS